MIQLREHKYEGDVLWFKCTKCGVWKPKDCFSINRINKTFGIKSECKECWRLRKRIRRDRDIENCKKYYVNNSSKILERIKGYSIDQTNKLGFNWETFHRKARKFKNKHGIDISNCPICGIDGVIQMHHPSYKREEDWSYVVFCCKSCHLKIHAGEIECPQPVNLLDLSKSKNY